MVDLGELSERSKEAVLKTVGGASLPGVRISHSPNLGTMAEPGLKQLLAKESMYIVWHPEVQILLVPILIGPYISWLGSETDNFEVIGSNPIGHII